MKTVLSALAVTGALLGTLACGHKDARPELKDLPRVAVSLVAPGSPEGGAWVAATLQSTRTAMMSTRMAAQVRRVTVQEGQRVAAGTLLISLGDEDLQGQLKAAETGLATVEAYHRRIQALQAQRASTAVELEQAQAQMAQAQAGVTGLKANIAYTQIRAPFSGVVQSRKVSEGDFVGPGMPLLELVGDGEQELVASLSDQESKGLKTGAKVKFESEGVQGEAQIMAWPLVATSTATRAPCAPRCSGPRGSARAPSRGSWYPASRWRASPCLAAPSCSGASSPACSWPGMAMRNSAGFRWVKAREATCRCAPG